MDEPLILIAIFLLGASCGSLITKIQFRRTVRDMALKQQAESEKPKSLHAA